MFAYEETWFIYSSLCGCVHACTRGIVIDLGTFIIVMDADFAGWTTFSPVI